MTRPIEVRPRESTTHGTRYEEFEVGKDLNPVHFTITRDFLADYIAAVDGDPQGYVVDGRAAAHPLTFAPFLAAVLFNTYPPQDGGVMAGQKWSFFRPLWLDEDVEIVATGKLVDKYEKRGRLYHIHSGEFRTRDGELIARGQDTSTWPD